MASKAKPSVTKPVAGKQKKAIERPGLTEDEIEEIREAFNLFDTDDDNYNKKKINENVKRKLL